MSAEQLVRTVAPGLALLPGGGGATDSTLALATAERRAFFRRVTSLYDGVSFFLESNDAARI